jgi:hypothetical protein
VGIAPGRCGRRDHPIRCELLTGYRRRRFQAEVALKYCSGSARRTETVFGWGRDAVHTGLNELRSGIRCLDAYHLRGRKKTEELCPAIEEQIRRLVDPHCQADPKFQTALAFTRITAKPSANSCCPAPRSRIPFSKRESYPYGQVKSGSVTASFAGEKDPTGYKGFDSSHNWSVQGSGAGLYSNDDIHAVRILLLEPTTEARLGRTYYNHGRERMRILGEIPVRKFSGDKQPLDPDGNPDTSFLAKVPAESHGPSRHSTSAAWC